jgi:hypothetical protein
MFPDEILTLIGFVSLLTGLGGFLLSPSRWEKLILVGFIVSGLMLVLNDPRQRAWNDYWASDVSHEHHRWCNANFPLRYDECRAEQAERWVHFRRLQENR